MHEIYAHEHPRGARNCPSIFLAGPSPRGQENYNWRPEALEYLKNRRFKGVVFVPLPRDGVWLENWDAQAQWEVDYLDRSTVIAFWVPRDMQHLPGLTTNIEFGLYAQSGKAVLGYPKSASYTRYMHFTAERFNIPVFHTLRETLGEALRRTRR